MIPEKYANTSLRADWWWCRQYIPQFHKTHLSLLFDFPFILLLSLELSMMEVDTCIQNSLFLCLYFVIHISVIRINYSSIWAYTRSRWHNLEHTTIHSLSV